MSRSVDIRLLGLQLSQLSLNSHGLTHNMVVCGNQQRWPMATDLKGKCGQQPGGAHERQDRG
jgi:hypothetical protein